MLWRYIDPSPHPPTLPDSSRAEEPKKNEVLIEVHAAGVNFPNTLIIEGKYQFKPPFPFAQGGEAINYLGQRKAVGKELRQVR